MEDFLTQNINSIENFELKDSVLNQEFREQWFVTTNINNSDSIKYPGSSDIRHDFTPDWILYFIISLLAFTAWLRIFYTKYLASFFGANVNYQLTVKLYEENNLLQRRISFALHIIYFISGGLYLSLLLKHFEWQPFQISSFNFFLILTAILAGFVLLRLTLMHVTAFLFVKQELFSRFLFHYYITNKTLGLILIPFLLALAYSEGIVKEVFIYSSLTIIISAYILRFFRTTLFIFKNVVLLFYLILYLCALEILPLVVILKFLLSLA